MGDFGAFEINVEGVVQHLGNTVVGPLSVGTYEPKDVDELAALQHLATVPYTPEGGEETTYAVQTAEAAPPVVIPDESAGVPEATLPEPPATTRTTTTTTTVLPAPPAGAAGDAAPAASPEAPEA